MRPASVLRQPAAALPLPPLWGETGREAASLPRHGRAFVLTPWLSRALTGVCAALAALTLALALAPRLLPVQTFTVLSGSMQPTIPVGAVVVATAVRPQDLRLGDIVTFTNPNHPDRLVTHRIRQIAQSPSGPLFETQGDANAAPDPWELQAKAPVYRRLFHVPLLGYLVVAGQSAAVRVTVLLAVALGFLLLWWRWDEE